MMPKHSAAFALMVALAACSGDEGSRPPEPTTHGHELYVSSAVSMASSSVSQTPLVAGQSLPAKVQAENGTLTGVSVKTDHPGYEGSGFVYDFVDAGDKLTVAFNNVAAGTYDVRIRYLAWGEQYNDISINNAPTQPDHFPATGGNWAIKTVSGVNLGNGTNTVTINTYWGYIGVDSIEIVPSTGTMKVQAENGTLTGVSVKTDHPGYEGSGFVYDFVDAGDKLTVAFNNVAAGTYDVRIRYHAWGEQYNYISVNNAPTQPDHFPATGGNWVFKTVSGVTLGNGTNTVTIDTYWGYIAVDSIEIVPSTVGGPSIVMTCEDGALLSAGSYTVENNQWGKAGVTEPYSQCVGNGGLAADGSVSARWTWTWPPGPGEVKGYPAIVFGQKPGYESTPGSNLPRRLDLISQATSSWATRSTHTGTGQLTYDLWLTSDPMPREYFLDTPITHEIMVAVEPYDGYGQNNPAWFVEDIVIDGVHYKTYKADNFPPSAAKQWRFLVFRMVTPKVQGALDFRPLFAYLKSRGFIEGNEYLSSIEFGTEPVEGSGDVTVDSFKATVH